MSGLLTAILSVVFYSFSYVFLHKGQVESDIEDNGLLAVLAIGFVTLGIGAEFLSHGSRVLFQVHKRQEIVGYGFAALSGVIGTLFGRLTVYASIKRLGATRGIVVGSAESLVTLNLTGSSFNVVLDQIKNNKPVVVWTTSHFSKPTKWVTWNHGKDKIKATQEEHAVLVVGFDPHHVYVNDPLTGKQALQVARTPFIESWVALGRQAVSYR